MNNTIKKHVQAFLKVQNCRETDIEYIPDTENGPITVKHRNKYYKVVDGKYLDDLYKDIVEDRESRHYEIPVEVWAEVAEGIEFNKDFQKAFLAKLDEKQLQELQTVIDPDNINKLKLFDFWYKLEDLDNADIFNHAIDTLFLFFNKNSILDEIVEEITSKGMHYLMEVAGIFEDVMLNEEGEDVFYVYSVGDEHWDIDNED